MLLYKDEVAFKKIINETSNYFHLRRSIVEKDYFVSLILKSLCLNNDNLIFKGGTSLSKCFKAINRFSEDIDLSMVSISIGERRKIKNNILKVCSELSFEIVNISNILSHRRFNRYLINYPKIFNDVNIAPNLILETTFITKSYPVIDSFVSNYIYEYLYSVNENSTINKYELSPFKIKTQTLERTYIDKVFAICDYYLKKKVHRSSRHIYDLYFLDKNINYDDNLNELIKEVYEERSQIESCLSAQIGMSVNKILEEIINTNYFKEDYIQLTNQISIKKVDYNKSLAILKKIISLKLFK